MSPNGIGPLVRQFVHERNGFRFAEHGRGNPRSVEARSAQREVATDTIELSEAALARFEAVRVKLGKLDRTSSEAPDVTPTPPRRSPQTAAEQLATADKATQQTPSSQGFP